jgi:N-acetylglucosamine-6-sulfatase
VHGLKGRRVNSYKSLRLAGKEYDIMYAVQCHNNSHELYNMKKDPVQMRNLHPSAPAEEGHKNPFNSGEQKLAGYDITRLLPRVDALLLVLKSCKGSACAKPWKELHPNEEVKNLNDAMDMRFDDKYKSVPKVRFNRCFKNGTIDLVAEGPQWKSGGLDNIQVFDLETDGQEVAQVKLTADEDEELVEGWEGEEGYWDDWE